MATKRVTRRKVRHADIHLTYSGGLALLQPASPDGVKWLEDNIGREHQPYWPNVTAEPRYTEDIIEGIEESGLMLAFSAPAY